MARKAYGLHATQVNTGTYADDPAYPIGSNEWNADIDPEGMLGFTPATADSSTIIIASGVATITDSVSVIAGESATTDTLDKIAITNTSQYDLVYLFAASSGYNITLTNTSSPSADGHVKTVSGSNETLSTTVPTILMRKGNYWYGYGGGVVNAVSDIGDVTISSIGSGELLKWNGSAWINQTLAESGIAASGAKLSDFAATTSAELAGTISDETGSGALAFATSPTLVTPALGTPASGVLTNCTGTAANLTAGTVSDNAITLAKMAPGTDGELITYDASGDPAAVAVGTATHVLTSNGAGAAPTFQAPAGGGATAVHAFTNTTTTNYAGTASSFGTVGAGDRDIYIKKIDANNEGVFSKIWKNGAAVEVQIA